VTLKRREAPGLSSNTCMPLIGVWPATAATAVAVVTMLTLLLLLAVPPVVNIVM
jgi:hypothetical protein